MKIVFCISYLSVPLAISIIEESPEDFIIVTDQDALDFLFSKLYGREKVFRVQPLSFLISRMLPIEVWSVMWYKYKYWSFFSMFKGESIYFFFEAYGHFEAWLLKRLSKNNQVFYKNVADLSYLESFSSLRTKLNWLLLKILYGQSTQVVGSAKLVYYSVSDRFLAEIKAIRLTKKADMLIVQEKLSAVFDIPNSSVLLLLGGIQEEKYVSEAEYNIKMKELLSNFDEKALVVKYHPRYPFADSVTEHITRLPDFLPANSILDKFQVVIGYDTSAIYMAANRGQIAISLLNYMMPEDIGNRNSLVEYLKVNTQEGKKIFFPEDIEELKAIISR